MKPLQSEMKPPDHQHFLGRSKREIIPRSESHTPQTSQTTSRKHNALLHLLQRLEKRDPGLDRRPSKEEIDEDDAALSRMRTVGLPSLHKTVEF